MEEQEVEQALVRLEAFGLQEEDIQYKEESWWISSRKLGIALGYGKKASPKNSDALRKRMSELYLLHQDEFEGLTEMRQVRGTGYAVRTRFFNEEACYIAAMLAQTDRAKAFRKALSRAIRVLREVQFVPITEVKKMVAESGAHRKQLDVASTLLAQTQNDLRAARAQLGWYGLKAQVDADEAVSWKEVDRAVTLYQLGLTAVEVGRVLRWSKDRVHRWLRAYRAATGVEIARKPRMSSFPVFMGDRFLIAGAKGGRQ